MEPHGGNVAAQVTLNPGSSTYSRLFRNRALMWLWSGETVSIFGDAFFNLAVMWMVYTQSGSALRTAFVQVVWHLSSILFGPLAGILADRWDRKRIMVVTNLLAAVVVGAVALVIFVQERLSLAVAFAAVFLLNSLTTFLRPARVSIMPQIVGRDLLATAAGLFAIVREGATFLGNALAGVVIAVMGAALAVVIDAVSFICVALCIAVAPLPPRTIPPASPEQRPSLLREVVDGWRAISGQPVIRAVVWLGLLLNVASFLGPLYPALVAQRLHGGAAAYGMLNAMGIAGAMAGGVLAGMLERRLGAGRVLVMGWSLAGACVLGMAASTAFPVTAALEAIQVFGLTVGDVSMGALSAALIPENYRGRTAGIAVALNVVAIPVGALIGGWLADILGVAPLFAAGGVWFLGVAALAYSNWHVRTARI